MEASDVLIEKIRKFEGPAPLGGGYGNTRGVYKGHGVDEEETEELLHEDLVPSEHIAGKLGMARTQRLFDALADFVYSLGTERLQDYSLSRKTVLHLTCLSKNHGLS